MTIRPETPSDRERIAEITIAAFKNHPHSQNTEQFIIEALRAAGALTLSLVAEVDGNVVGHIAFSPATISDGSPDWYGVGPISVWPARQRQGIGQALVREGLSRLQSLGAAGCLLVGDPAYYGRFGFRNDPDLVYEGIPQEYFFVLPFGPRKARGVARFHEGFAARG